MFGLFKKKEAAAPKVKRDVLVPQGSVYEYPGEFYDLVFAEIADETGRLFYAGKIQRFKGEYCWFSGDPTDTDSQFDEGGTLLPILSHADLEVVRYNIDMHTKGSSLGHKLGSEMEIHLEDLERMAG